MERTLQIGDTLEEKYEILRKIGEGGMGEVYEGRHVALEMRVAIKVLRPFEKNDEAAMRSRFKAEAQSAASIKHPNVVEVRDFGFTPDDRPFFVMKFMDGESLADLLDREKVLQQGRMVAIVEQILSGLARAHKNEIIHRDLKPGNIFLAKDEDGQEIVKILDFGISKVANQDDLSDGAETRAGHVPLPENARMNTEVGEVLGTPGYVAPESITKQGVIDTRVDLFAVGVLVFEMLTGQRPFRGENARTILVNTARNPVPNMRELNPHIRPEMEQMCLMALAKDPDERFHTAEEFSEYLAAAAQGQTPENNRNDTIRVGLPQHFLDTVKAAKKRNTAKNAKMAAAAMAASEQPLELDLRDVENPENFDRRSSVAGNPSTLASTFIAAPSPDSPRESSVPVVPEPSGLHIPGPPVMSAGETTGPESIYLNSLNERRISLSSAHIKILVGLIIVALATYLVAGTTLFDSRSNDSPTVAVENVVRDSNLTPALPPTVSIWLDITPFDSQLRWNGELMVGNPLRIPISDRPAKVEITKAGFKRKVLVVTPNAEQTVRTTLKRQKATPKSNSDVVIKRADTDKKATTKKHRKRNKKKATAKKRRKRKKKKATTQKRRNRKKKKEPARNQ